MMNRYRHNNATSVQEQAAEWLVELAEADVSENSRRRFMSWLKKSPQHIKEFLVLAATQQELAEQSTTVADIVEELEELRIPDNQSVLPLFAEPPTAGAEARTSSHRGRRHYLLWASAACVALTALVLLQFPPAESPSTVTHRTALGEQRSVVLNDGSIVTLNTLSEATVRFDSEMRHVTLTAGEAMFDVVNDPERPFVVETGVMSLNVLGTKFSVYRKGDSARVAVVDGVVRAMSTRSPDEPVLVRAGEGAVATSQGVTLRDRLFDVEKAIAWTERRLIFDGAPLGEVVGEFNRYNRTPLIVEDGALANREITTVFRAHDVSALISFLELDPDVEVEYGDSSIRIRVKR